MTLSFHKVMFSAQEVLDLITDARIDHDICGCDGLVDLEIKFSELAEQRSRGNL